MNVQGAKRDGPRVLDPRATFGPDTFARLVDVKRPKDPDNVFRIARNIPPM